MLNGQTLLLKQVFLKSTIMFFFIIDWICYHLLLERLFSFPSHDSTYFWFSFYFSEISYSVYPFNHFLLAIPAQTSWLFFFSVLFYSVKKMNVQSNELFFGRVYRHRHTGSACSFVTTTVSDTEMFSHFLRFSHIAPL